jgi:light-regulated signal transduction histidine kinase (bacteriophytochrome)
VRAKFDENHEAILAGIAAQAGIAIDNARLFEQERSVRNQLQQSNEELLRANRDLEAFAYSASHDLQEPLRTIAISAQLVQRNCAGELGQENITFLENILTATRRMRVLIDDLLVYTRATRQEASPAPNVDASRVLEQVLESLRAQMEEAGAVVTSSSLPHVAIHAGRLSQVFQNLISNSIKYRGREAPRIHVTAAQADGWCTFSVTDNGIGIEREFAGQIFGLFKRLHPRSDYPGSGIGLAICQRVVELYGGRIWLEQSEPGKGSTFSFSLPAGNKH